MPKCILRLNKWQSDRVILRLEIVSLLICMSHDVPDNVPLPKEKKRIKISMAEGLFPSIMLLL
jgi:hypothetical protein